MARSMIGSAMEGIFGTAMKLGMGTAHGLAEGLSFRRFGKSTGATHFTGRMVGNLMGYPAGAVGAAASYATGSAAVGAAKKVPGILGDVGHVAAQTAVYNTKKALGVSRVVGQTLVGGKLHFGNKTISHPGLFKDTERNLGNLFIGKELRPTPGFIGEAGLIGAGVLAASGKARDNAALGTISGYNPDNAGPEALSYDGMGASVPSRMGNMGGTGDLVTALHANRHGR